MNKQFFINQIMNNPQLRQNAIFQNAFQLVNSGNTKELEEMVRNVAKEKGVDIDNLRKQYGI